MLKASMFALALLLVSCTTVHEYPIRPHTCQYDGGINLTNAPLLQIAAAEAPIARGDIFGSKDTVLINGYHYSYDSFRPVIMCVDPELSGSLPIAVDDAEQEIRRRYSLMGAAFAVAPALPFASVPVLAMLGISSTLSGIVGYLHQEFFEPGGEKLQAIVTDFNVKVAKLVSTRNETSPVARLNAGATY